MSVPVRLSARCLLVGFVSLALALTAVAAAHATLVIGTLTLEPDPTAGAAAIAVSIDLEDPGLVEVEDAVIFLELRAAPASGVATRENEQPQGEALYVSDRLAEISPGHYIAQLPGLLAGAPLAGDYTISVRDRTYRQEEAVANLVVSLGDEEVGEVVFVLPPTDIGPASLGTWLLWLIVVPLLAGVIVTILVLRGGKDEAPDDGAEPT